MKKQQQVLKDFDVELLRRNILLGVAKARFKALPKSDQKQQLADAMKVVQSLLDSEK